MKNKHSLLTSPWFLFASLVMATLTWTSAPSTACDVAVISGKVTSNGRPVIWKNRDHGPRWEQEIRYYPATHPEVGPSVRIVDRATTAPLLYKDGAVSILSGGLNASGFAITNTTVYENDPVHEYYSNANHLLMEVALETCKTVDDFDALLADYRNISENWDKIISGNFVVIDAKGGAALYEIFSGFGFQAYLNPLMINKFDANDPEDAPLGFVNRTNSHKWIQRNSDTQREVRGRDILTDLYDENDLSFENVLLILAKDVCGDDPNIVDGIPITSPHKYKTKYCISRYMTNIAMVVDGVADGGDPSLATLWCNLGEPSIGVSTPHFASAGGVTPYAWAEQGLEPPATPVDTKVTCALNQAINDQEIDGLYINNWDYGYWYIEMDTTIDYALLKEVQEWTIPLEQRIIDHTETILDGYRNGNTYTSDDLYALSHYAAGYMYENYTNQSDTALAWNFGGITDEPTDPPDDGQGDDPGDTDPPDDGNNSGFFTQFMLWLLGLFG